MRTHYAAICTPLVTTIACYSRCDGEERGRRHEEPSVRGPTAADGISAVRDQVTCPDCIEIAEGWET